VIGLAINFVSVPESRWRGSATSTKRKLTVSNIALLMTATILISQKYGFAEIPR
jgi:hypothetical protein